jgi:tetratricopeptide (TPR) repeat protein
MNKNYTPAEVLQASLEQSRNYTMKALRIAFAFSMLLVFFALYLYITVTPEKLFSKNFHPYELHTMRGVSNSSALKEAYKNGKMDSVIWEFNSLTAAQPEEYLLAGIAYLEKNQPEKAIETFKTMIQKNENSKTDFFEQDAEYYLAMSYLDNHEPGKAMPIFERINADSENPYNSNVSEWFLLNVKTSIAKK